MSLHSPRRRWRREGAACAAALCYHGRDDSRSERHSHRRAGERRHIGESQDHRRELVSGRRRSCVGGCSRESRRQCHARSRHACRQVLRRCILLSQHALLDKSRLEPTLCHAARRRRLVEARDGSPGQARRSPHPVAGLIPSKAQACAHCDRPAPRHSQEAKANSQPHSLRTPKSTHSVTAPPPPRSDQRRPWSCAWGGRCSRGCGRPALAPPPARPPTAAYAGLQAAGPDPAQIGPKPTNSVFSAPAPIQKRHRSRSKRFFQGFRYWKTLPFIAMATPGPASKGEESDTAARSKRRRRRMPAQDQSHSRQKKSRQKYTHAGIIFVV